jgi:uncharacterized protein YnzC (UPF0291/DUF896 family)
VVNPEGVIITFPVTSFQKIVTGICSLLYFINIFMASTTLDENGMGVKETTEQIAYRQEGLAYIQAQMKAQMKIIRAERESQQIKDRLKATEKNLIKSCGDAKHVESKADTP